MNYFYAGDESMPATPFVEDGGQLYVNLAMAVTDNGPEREADIKVEEAIKAIKEANLPPSSNTYLGEPFLFTLVAVFFLSARNIKRYIPRLIDAGIVSSINEKNSIGESAFHRALRLSCIETAQVLYEMGADPYCHVLKQGFECPIHLILTRCDFSLYQKLACQGFDGTHVTCYGNGKCKFNLELGVADDTDYTVQYTRAIEYVNHLASIRYFAKYLHYSNVTYLTDDTMFLIFKFASSEVEKKMYSFLSVKA